VLIVMISAGAEITVGAWSKLISLSAESAIRATLAIGVGILIYVWNRLNQRELSRGTSV
jgi:hypothetical protein